MAGPVPVHPDVPVVATWDIGPQNPVGAWGCAGPGAEGFGLWRHRGDPSKIFPTWDAGAWSWAGRRRHLVGPLFARVLAW